MLYFEYGNLATYTDKDIVPSIAISQYRMMANWIASLGKPMILAIFIMLTNYADLLCCKNVIEARKTHEEFDILVIVHGSKQLQLDNSKCSRINRMRSSCDESNLPRPGEKYPQNLLVSLVPIYHDGVASENRGSRLLKQKSKWS